MASAHHQPPVPLDPRSLLDSLPSEVLPDRADLSVRVVGEGGGHATWWVGERHVLRLALDADGRMRQLREIALRDALRARLTIPVPESAAVGEWAPGRTYTLDTRLPGVSAESRRVSAAGECDLAHLLDELSSFPTGTAAALGVPTVEPRELGALHQKARQLAQRLYADGEFGRSSVRPPGPQVSAEPYASVLLHADLKGEHLLIADDGRVCGALDWTDTVIGDPAEDIAGLAIAIGAPAALRTAVLAGHSTSLCARALHLAHYDTLIRLADRLYCTDDSPLPLLRVQLSRAWAATPLDRPDAP